MNIITQIIIGILLGIVCIFINMGIMAKKYKSDVDFEYKNLIEALNFRYLKLKNVLLFLKKHMTGFEKEIENLLSVCNKSLELPSCIKNIKEKLGIENEINYKLEDIKSNMKNFPSIENDDEVNSAIIAIAESEIHTGVQIDNYNKKVKAYKTVTESFPASIIFSILNKNNSHIDYFFVTNAKEFASNYIDEDEI